MRDVKTIFACWPRTVAALFHFAISLAIATLVALVIFALWYPGDYKYLAGGRHLFWIIVFVDVVMGPLLTFVVFNTAKLRKELWRDLAIIALLQLGALSYGLYTLFEARPIALVFEVDRFRVVSAADVLKVELAAAPSTYRDLPVTGPWLLGVRTATDGGEKIDSIGKALQGFDVGQRPSYWQPYDASRAQVLARSRPVKDLLAQYPSQNVQIQALLKELELPMDGARFLPTNARMAGWVTLLRSNGDVAGFAPFDGFF